MEKLQVSKKCVHAKTSERLCKNTTILQILRYCTLKGVAPRTPEVNQEAF